MAGKRARAAGSWRPAKKQRVHPERFQGGADEVLQADVRALRARYFLEAPLESPSHATSASAKQESSPAVPRMPERFSELDVKILELSSTGDGLGESTEYPDYVFVVPFTVPGDIVRAKVVREDLARSSHCLVTDFLSAIKPSPRRDDRGIRCKYFSQCSGCQLQMLPYEDQLRIKQTVVQKAFANFSNLPPEKVPSVRPTMASPLQYGYRTKLTPHFDGPPGHRQKKQTQKPHFKEVPPIGFNIKNTRRVLDVEDCPIGTGAVREGMQRERRKLIENYKEYTNGATILLRENTQREMLPAPPSSTPAASTSVNGNEVSDQTPRYQEVKTCVSESNESITEYVDDYVFETPAGAFFQNNNSILSPLMAYLRAELSTISSASTLTHLIDAYCGSALFTISLSSLFQSSIGIDIASRSIESAENNARLNNVQNAKFLTATAADIFKSVRSDPNETVVVIDPPRKGCDEDFLQQLLGFGPRCIVYVSCNVHSEARDVGTLVTSTPSGPQYAIRSIRGCDFFPQTAHVESVVMLERCDAVAAEEKAPEG